MALSKSTVLASPGTAFRKLDSLPELPTLEKRVNHKLTREIHLGKFGQHATQLVHQHDMKTVRAALNKVITARSRAELHGICSATTPNSYECGLGRGNRNKLSFTWNDTLSCAENVKLS